MTDINATHPTERAPSGTPASPLTVGEWPQGQPMSGPLPDSTVPKTEIMAAPPGMAVDLGNVDTAVHHLGPNAALEAMAASQGRYGELQGDTFGAGSQIGDLLPTVPVPSDFGKADAGENGPLPSSTNQDT